MFVERPFGEERRREELEIREGRLEANVTVTQLLMVSAMEW